MTRYALDINVKMLLLTAFVSFSKLSWAGQESQVLVMADNKRLEASICPDSMNRLAVAHDRIVQVFGDEGAFESQSEENTGQVFIKPTAENSLKPLSLTLITEQGKTQDLSLKPTAKTAATLILKTAKPSKKTDEVGGTVETVQPHHPPLPTAQQFSVQEQILTVLKQAVRGSLPLRDSVPSHRQAPDGYFLTPHQSFQGWNYAVHIFFLENKTSTPVEVQERSFYQPGDLAISISNRVLESKARTQLYVVCREEGDSQ